MQVVRFVKALGISAVVYFCSSPGLSAGTVRAIPELPEQLKNISASEIAIPVTLAPVRYPVAQAKSRIETVVWVRAFVNKEGEVEKAIIACGDVPSKEFEVAALSATLASSFKPGERRGKPAYKWFYHPVAFDKKMAKKVRKALRLAKEDTSVSDQTVSATFANSAGTHSYPGPDDFVVCDAMPEMIEEATIRYPTRARNKGVEGRVWVKALVDETGGVKAAYAAKSSGNVYLDRAALDAAVKNKFNPAKKDGLPVAIWVSYKVDFVLNKD